MPVYVCLSSTVRVNCLSEQLLTGASREEREREREQLSSEGARIECTILQRGDARPRVWSLDG